jgi:hypothetical protein
MQPHVPLLQAPCWPQLLGQDSSPQPAPPKPGVHLQVALGAMYSVWLLSMDASGLPVEGVN